MKKFFTKLLSLLLCGSMLLSMAPITIYAESEGENNMYITDLKVNNLAEPLGIDTAPVFKWVNRMNGYAKSQSAYQIIVASTAEKAAAHNGDVWDSGKVSGTQNYDIPYGGKALASRTAYFFAVQVWDEEGNTVWSDVSKFETGILDDAEWTAKWIGGNQGITTEYDLTVNGSNWIWFRNGGGLNDSAGGDMYIRKTFTTNTSKTVKQVLYLETVDNTAVSYMNGTPFSKVTSWKKGAFTDVTSLVKNGENIIAIKANNEAKGAAGYIAKIEIRYTDGSKETIITDSTWKFNAAPTGDWTSASYNDSAWKTPDQSLAYGSSPWNNSATLPNTITVGKHTSAPMLRKSFDIQKDIAKARIYIVGLGLYDLYVNGENPDDTVLNPAHTQYEDTVHYRAYDVTEMLSSGKNAIAVELGDGFYHLNLGSWSWNSAPWYDDTKLLFELDIEYTDGTKETIVSDESWKTYGDGPITVNNMYLGDTYDATKEVENWTSVTFDDSAWDAVSLMNAPEGDIAFENMEPMRKLATYTPTVKKVADGKWLITSPLMVTGWAKINIDAPKGTEIKISYGEKLDTNGDFVYAAFSGNDLQRDVYIAGGYEGETYEPKFSYKGYKYILVENHAAEITPEDVECYMIANDVELISNFGTGNKTVNDLHGIVLRTLLNNFQGKPSDTPVYEKNGWTGDYNVALDMIHYNYDVSNFNAKFMQDMEDAQTADGIVPLVAPIAANWSGGHKHNPSWNMAYIGGVYSSWQYSGNFSLVEEHYDSMRECALAYIKVLEGNGYVWLDDLYGDWVVPDHVGAYSPEGSGIICTAYAYRGLEYMAIFADEMGKTADAAQYREVMAKVYDAFNAKYYDAEKGYYDTGWWNSGASSSTKKYRQTSNLIPLAFGLCPDEYKESVAASIVTDIVDTRSLHLNTGCIGTKHVLPELSNAGYGDIAYDLLMQNTYPSWGYWLVNGSDSAWESWPIGARSYNHYFLATYDDWFFTHLAGIRDIANGYETVTLKPEIYLELGYVNCTIDTVRGTLESSWGYNESGTLVWTVRVPVGTTATVYLPLECTSVNGKALTAQEGITVNADNLTVLSGEYNFALDTLEFEKEDLANVIAMGESYSVKNYPTDKFASFTEVLNAAKTVYNTEGATSVELYNAKSSLLDAMETLADYNSGNLALGKSVSVSSDVGNAGWNKGRLTDGDRINKSTSTEQHLGWTSNESTSTNHAEWVTVDLGAYYKFDKICIMPSGNKTEDALCEGFPKDFTISVSKDGESWTTLVNETNYPVPYATLQEFEVDMSYARYVRLYASSLNKVSNDSNKYRMQLAEIEVYNTSAVDDGITRIGTANDLVALMKASSSWSGEYKLTADIDLTGLAQNPIGTLSNPFTGTFDGDGHTISGLNLSGAGYVGLFGYTSGCEISNLTLKGSVTSSNKYAGGFIGHAVGNTVITDCVNEVNVTITGDKSINKKAGGFIGQANDNAGSVTIIRCVNKGDINAYGYAGGFIGRAVLANLTVTDSANYGDIDGIDARLGGFIGCFIHNSSNGSFLLNNLYNEGTVYTVDTHSGGIIGNMEARYANKGTISNCMNAGDIVTSSAKTAFGGIIGIDNKNIAYTIENVYVSGSMGGKDAIAGAKQSAVTYKNCYYLDSNATNNAGATKVTTDNYANPTTFAGFTSDYWMFTKFGPELKTFHEHTEEILDAVEPTYTSTGLTEGKKCSVCDEILEAQKEIPKLVLENDLNSDGRITVTDALLLLSALVNNQALDGGDINGDGKLDLLDVLRSLKIAVA